MAISVGEICNCFPQGCENASVELEVDMNGFGMHVCFTQKALHNAEPERCLVRLDPWHAEQQDSSSHALSPMDSPHRTSLGNLLKPRRPAAPLHPLSRAIVMRLLGITRERRVGHD